MKFVSLMFQSQAAAPAVPPSGHPFGLTNDVWCCPLALRLTWGNADVTAHTRIYRWVSVAQTSSDSLHWDMPLSPVLVGTADPGVAEMNTNILVDFSGGPIRVDTFFAVHYKDGIESHGWLPAPFSEDMGDSGSFEGLIVHQLAAP